jgi:hypothetical protein
VLKVAKFMSVLRELVTLLCSESRFFTQKGGANLIMLMISPVLSFSVIQKRHNLNPMWLEQL